MQALRESSGESRDLFRYHRKTNTIEIVGGANLWLRGRRGRDSVKAGGNLIIGEEHEYSRAADSLVMGHGNEVSGRSNLIAGKRNKAAANFAFTTSSRSTVKGVMSHSIGGERNFVSGDMGIAIGGGYNNITGKRAALISGEKIVATGYLCVGIGGSQNNITGMQAVAIGSINSGAHGHLSTIISGDSLSTSGFLALAAGGQLSKKSCPHRSK